MSKAAATQRVIDAVLVADGRHPPEVKAISALLRPDPVLDLARGSSRERFREAPLQLLPIVGMHGDEGSLVVSDSSSLRPVSSIHRSLTHSSRPSASQVQMICGSALASLRYSFSLMHFPRKNPQFSQHAAGQPRIGRDPRTTWRLGQVALGPIGHQQSRDRLTFSVAARCMLV